MTPALHSPPTRTSTVLSSRHIPKDVLHQGYAYQSLPCSHGIAPNIIAEIKSFPSKSYGHRNIKSTRPLNHVPTSSRILASQGSYLPGWAYTSGSHHQHPREHLNLKPDGEDLSTGAWWRTWLDDEARRDSSLASQVPVSALHRRSDNLADSMAN